MTPLHRIRSRGLVIGEFVLLFALICVHGSWPVPDVNEVYYVGKAIHFWNPDWVRGDTFLESKDAHSFFYVTVGSLSLILSPTAFAWVARLLAWLFFTWAWQRLSFTVIPKRFASILTAAGLLYLLDAFTMSGEWLIGGVEGKSYAFPLMFLGLQQMLRGHWRAVWPLLGAASAFHVLVGGWAVLIALSLWTMEQLFCGVKEIFGKNTEQGNSSRFFSFLSQFFWAGVKQLPFLILGGLFSLFGLIPALLLDHGVSPEIASKAHYIYVYERLAHHLHPAGFPWTFKLRFGVLTLLWFTLCAVMFFGRFSDGKEIEKRFWRLNAFVSGTVILGGIGFFIAWYFKDDPKRCADLLRLYWFRMCDFAVPMGVSFMSVTLLIRFAGIWETFFRRSTEPLRFLRNSFLFATVSFGIGAVMFLIFDAIVFGWWFASWLNLPSNPGEATPNIPAEPVVPWIITLLFSVVLIGVYRYFAQRSRQKEKSAQKSLVLCAWIVLLSTLVFWGPLNFYSQRAEQRMRFAYPRSDPAMTRYAYWWNDICRWIAEEENAIPQDARFLTPKELENFKWLTRRPEVGIWKEIPQDAQGILQWYHTMEVFYTYRPKNKPPRRDLPLQFLLKRFTPGHLESLRKKYDYDYILCGKYPALDLPIVYENPAYVVYTINGNKRVVLE